MALTAALQGQETRGSRSIVGEIRLPLVAVDYNMTAGKGRVWSILDEQVPPDTQVIAYDRGELFAYMGRVVVSRPAEKARERSYVELELLPWSRLEWDGTHWVGTDDWWSRAQCKSSGSSS